jgi:hypothetical protein
MLRHAKAQSRHDTSGPRTVRVLHSRQELAEAQARASVHARRLQDRLEARAARDARTVAYRSDEAPICSLSGADTLAGAAGPLATDVANTTCGAGLKDRTTAA